MTKAEIENLADYTILRIGHSTILFKLNGELWLSDPVFSERTSPFSFIGPKRFHQPPIGIEELPPIKGVIISHDHYDHLDEMSIQRLSGKVEKFYVPLGVDNHLKAFGINADKIVALDWWQSAKSDETTLVLTPPSTSQDDGSTIEIPHYGARG